MEKSLLALLVVAMAMIVIGRVLGWPWLSFVGESIWGLFIVAGALTLVIVWVWTALARRGEDDEG